MTDYYNWVDSDCRRFVYYNWLPLLEHPVIDPGENETITILRKYTWDLDMSGLGGGAHTSGLSSIDAADGQFSVRLAQLVKNLLRGVSFLFHRESPPPAAATPLPWGLAISC